MKALATSFADILPNAALDQIRSSGDAVSRLGAKLLAQMQFVKAMLAQLSVTQRCAAANMLRRGVENVMARPDDVATPPEYRATLLNRANILLAALESASVPRRLMP